MNPRIIIAFFSLLLSSTGFSQQRVNAFSIELGRTRNIGNLSFDHRISYGHFGVRSFVGFPLTRSQSVFTIGSGAYHLWGKGNHFLETGLDIGYLNIGKETSGEPASELFRLNFPTKTAFAAVNLGYRYYGKKTLVRVGGSPYYIHEGIFLGAFFSLGLTF